MAMNTDLCRFSDISGMNGWDVVDTKGNTVGKISDLAFDPESGQIRYGLVKADSVLGIGGKTLAIPFRSMDFRGKKVHVSRTKDDLMHGPWSDADRVLSSDEERTAYNYWGEPYYRETTVH